jgi:ASC-1-like (ASCH) protein
MATMYVCYYKLTPNAQLPQPIDGDFPNKYLSDIDPLIKSMIITTINNKSVTHLLPVIATNILQLCYTIPWIDYNTNDTMIKRLNAHKAIMDQFEIKDFTIDYLFFNSILYGLNITTSKVFNDFKAKLLGFKVANIGNFLTFNETLNQFNVKNIDAFNTFMSKLSTFKITDIDTFNEFMAKLSTFNVKNIETFNTFMTTLSTWNIKDYATFQAFMTKIQPTKNMDNVNTFMNCTSAPDKYYGLEYINTYGVSIIKKNVTNIDVLAASCNDNKVLFNAFLNYSKTQNSKYPNALRDFVINTSIPASAKTEVASLIDGSNNKVNQNLTEIALYIGPEEFDSMVSGTFDSSNILCFMRDVANAIKISQQPPPNNDLNVVALLFYNFPYLCFEYMQLQLINGPAKYRTDQNQWTNSKKFSYRNKSNCEIPAH